jgi:hypothetical protein
MMHGTFTSIDGSVLDIDMDRLKVICQGKSAIKPGWSAMLVHSPDYDTLIELRDSPPDIRGFSNSESTEVTVEYALEAYQLSEDQLREKVRRPTGAM